MLITGILRDLESLYEKDFFLKTPYPKVKLSPISIKISFIFLSPKKVF